MYPSLESEEFAQAVSQLATGLDDLDGHLKANGIARGGPLPAGGPPGLAATLRTWLASHSHPLAFPTPNPSGTLERPGSRVDGHILRLCKSVAKSAGMDQDKFWLHKFRATYATHCLREGMDLETLRKQLGHRDVESLRRYLEALKGEECMKKVAEIFAAWTPAQEPARQGAVV